MKGEEFSDTVSEMYNKPLDCESEGANSHIWGTNCQVIILLPHFTFGLSAWSGV